MNVTEYYEKELQTRGYQSDPAQRAAGVGKQLIEWLAAEMKRKRWSRLYWHTRLNNYRARGLYDKFTSHSDFVRYTIYESGV